MIIIFLLLNFSPYIQLALGGSTTGKDVHSNSWVMVEKSLSPSDDDWELVVPESTLSHVLEQIQSVAQEAEEKSASPTFNPQDRKKTQHLLKQVKQAQEAGRTAFSSHKELTTSNPHVRQVFSAAQQFVTDSFIERRFQELQDQLKEAMELEEQDMKAATSKKYVSQAQNLSGATTEELEEIIPQFESDPLDKLILQNHLRLKEETKTLAPLFKEEAKNSSNEILESVTEPSNPKFESYQKELKNRGLQNEATKQCTKVSGVFSFIKNLFNKTDEAIKYNSPCGSRLNIDEKLAKLKALKITDSTKPPIPDFPELNGPPFRVNQDHLSEYIDYLLGSSPKSPTCLKEEEYLDGVTLYQAVKQQGYVFVTPAQIQGLLLNMKNIQKRWVHEASLREHPVVIPLLPWPVEPSPEAILMPDGQVVLTFGLVFLGSGSFKDAYGAFTLDLKKKRMTDSTQFVVLPPKEEKKKGADIAREIEMTGKLHDALTEEKKAGRNTSGIMNSVIVELSSVAPSKNGEKSKTIVQERMDSDMDAYMKKKPDPETSIRLLRDVAEGISNLHRLGFVHGDLKEANVFIRQTPGVGLRAKVADFGGLANAETEAPVVTTPRYSPPEYYTEETLLPKYREKVITQPTIRKDLHQKHDVFSLGVMAFHASRGIHFNPYPHAFKTRVILDSSGRPILNAQGKFVTKIVYDAQGALEDFNHLTASVKKRCSNLGIHCLEWIALKAINPNPQDRSNISQLSEALKMAIMPGERKSSF